MGAVTRAVLAEGMPRAGCCDEFRQLLGKYARPDDTLILAGDLVNKGPKSGEVVTLARERRALAVVGNHELASLRAYTKRAGGANPDVETYYAWTDGLAEEDVDFLRNLPFTISLPLHNAIVVHAGLVPGIPLHEQSPLTMVTMRNLHRLEGDTCGGHGGRDGAFEASESCKNGSAWAPLWQGPEHIYFG